MFHSDVTSESSTIFGGTGVRGFDLGLRAEQCVADVARQRLWSRCRYPSPSVQTSIACLDVWFRVVPAEQVDHPIDIIGRIAAGHEPFPRPLPVWIRSLQGHARIVIGERIAIAC